MVGNHGHACPVFVAPSADWRYLNVQIAIPGRGGGYERSCAVAMLIAKRSGKQIATSRLLHKGRLCRKKPPNGGDYRPGITVGDMTPQGCAGREDQYTGGTGSTVGSDQSEAFLPGSGALTMGSVPVLQDRARRTHTSIWGCLEFTRPLAASPPPLPFRRTAVVRRNPAGPESVANQPFPQDQDHEENKQTHPRLPAHRGARRLGTGFGRNPDYRHRGYP